MCAAHVHVAPAACLPHPTNARTVPSLITDIRQAKNRSDRFVIVVDGNPAGVLSVCEIADLRLEVGRGVDASLAARIQSAAELLSAYDRALAMLARGPRSLFDLRRRLAAKGEGKAAILWALARLQEEGVVGDEDFALQYTRSRLARGSSRSAVISGLLRLAVDRGVAEGAVDLVAGEEGWDESAASITAAARKMRSLNKLEPVVARRRLIGFLRRRGYTATAIREALAKLSEDVVNPD
jgi:regulatory protein